MAFLLQCMRFLKLEMSFASLICELLISTFTLRRDHPTPNLSLPMDGWMKWMCPFWEKFKPLRLSPLVYALGHANGIQLYRDSNTNHKRVYIISTNRVKLGDCRVKLQHTAHTSETAESLESRCNTRENKLLARVDPTRLDDQLYRHLIRARCQEKCLLLLDCTHYNGNMSTLNV